MQLCTFQQITERIDGRANFQCTACGRIVYRCKSVAEKIYADCSRPTPKSPTMLEKMASAAKASANFLISGGKTVSGEVFHERMEVCRQCPAYHPTFQQCGDCGCFLALKAWLPKPDGTCPRKQWKE